MNPQIDAQAAIDIGLAIDNAVFSLNEIKKFCNAQLSLISKKQKEELAKQQEKAKEAEKPAEEKK